MRRALVTPGQSSLASRLGPFTLALALACSAADLTRPSDSPSLRSGRIATYDSSATVTVIGAGDVHAGCLPYYHDEATARLVAAEPNALVFTAGDNAGTYGNAEEYRCYDRSWGAFKDRTYPDPARPALKLLLVRSN